MSGQEPHQVGAPLRAVLGAPALLGAFGRNAVDRDRVDEVIDHRPVGQHAGQGVQQGPHRPVVRRLTQSGGGVGDAGVVVQRGDEHGGSAFVADPGQSLDQPLAQIEGLAVIPRAVGDTVVVMGVVRGREQRLQPIDERGDDARASAPEFGDRHVPVAGLASVGPPQLQVFDQAVDILGHVVSTPRGVGPFHGVWRPVIPCSASRSRRRVLKVWGFRRHPGITGSRNDRKQQGPAGTTDGPRLGRYPQFGWAFNPANPHSRGVRALGAASPERRFVLSAHSRQAASHG